MKKEEEALEGSVSALVVVLVGEFALIPVGVCCVLRCALEGEEEDGDDDDDDDEAVAVGAGGRESAAWSLCCDCIHSWMKMSGSTLYDV